MVRIVCDEPDPAVVKKISCRGCGARLEYVPNDVRSRHGTDYGGGPDGAEWVDCPRCGKQVIIRSW